MEQLEPLGYMVVPKAVVVEPEIEEALIKASARGYRNIFNPKRKRAQRDINSCRNPVVKRFIADCNIFLKKLFPSRVPNDWVIIRSLPGCQQQQAHTDYLPNSDFKDRTKAPLNAMVFFQEGSTLEVWEGTQNWIQFDSSQMDGLPEVQCRTLKFDVGDILIFYGDLIHAGSSYSNSNYRLHAYLDTPCYIRPLNVTNIIARGPQQLSRKIIECPKACL